jgi:hypothetical protein
MIGRKHHKRGVPKPFLYENGSQADAWRRVSCDGFTDYILARNLVTDIPRNRIRLRGIGNDYDLIGPRYGSHPLNGKRDHATFAGQID